MYLFTKAVFSAFRFYTADGYSSMGGSTYSYSCRSVYRELVVCVDAYIYSGVSVDG